MKRKRNIRHNIFIAVFITMFLVVFTSISGFTQLPQIKNETIYANLNHDGSIREEKTINWINITNSLEDSSKEFIDYGEYTDIKNMVNGEKPKIEGAKIIWPYDAFKSGSLFYEGTTKKELPIDISIKYALDGKEIKGEELAGKSGKLKIEIKINNKLKQVKEISYEDYYGNNKPVKEDYYIPLMVQVSLKVDVTKFTDILADGSTKVLTGKEMNISFADFPFPESDFTVVMYGEDIELNAINIVAIPSEIPLTTDLDETEKSLYEFDDGLIKMEDGSEDMVDGTERLNKGLSELKNGSNDLVNAISEINNGLGTLSSSNEDISRGFSDIISGLSDFNSKSGELVNAAGQLSSNIASIKNGLDQSASGAWNISAITADLTAGVGDLKNVHNNLVGIAQLLVASDPGNATYQQLLAIANGEMDAINSIYGGMQGISGGMKDLSAGISSMAGGVSQYSDGLNQFSSNITVLPSALDQLIGGQGQLASAWSRYSGAVSDLHDGTDKLYAETQILPDNISKIIDGNLKIKDGIRKLKEDGISGIRNKIIENINNVKSGIALSDELNLSYENYRSFMDNNKNRNSQVQFILQTDEIKIQKITADNTKEEVKSEGFLDRLIKLFKK